MMLGSSYTDRVCVHCIRKPPSHSQGIVIQDLMEFNKRKNKTQGLKDRVVLSIIYNIVGQKHNAIFIPPRIHGDLMHPKNLSISSVIGFRVQYRAIIVLVS